MCSAGNAPLTPQARGRESPVSRALFGAILKRKGDASRAMIAPGAARIASSAATMGQRSAA